MNDIVRITRSVNDSAFSMDDLFYRYFYKMPLLFFQAGSTDLYDRPQTTIGSDDEDPENPHKGPEELEKVIQKLFSFLSKNEVEEAQDRSLIDIAKYCNFPNNSFCAFVIFKSHQVIIRLQVAPGKRETMTAVSIMGCSEEAKIWKLLLEHCQNYIQPAVIRQDEINIITMSDGDFYLKSIPLINHNQEFSYDFYNDDFQAISERVTTALQATNESGLVLFHGNPGTGKTSYLKYLLHTISKKKLIYLPPDLIESLSAPNFISFLLSQAANSILLIEDAENVLKQREAGGNQAVSNILNISDGILGDILRLQIVCTFNSKLQEIDQALLRPGRLICEYRFEKLTVKKTAGLMKKLYNIELTEQREMTLADIFNYDKMPDKTKIKRHSVGFVNTEKD
ncbi:MAG: AAA family ATPase [Thaumarchaeota archaeon]|nr:AAA family ATPase [Nitrososphaerota archaeon]